jgi:8-oxo-dGTP diphosphatase
MERSVAGILLREGRVFIAKRGPEGSFSGYWEFPGGKVEQGESDEEALMREFEEEFELRVRPRRMVGECLFPHRGTERVLAAWLIEPYPDSQPRLLEHEALSWADAGELEALRLVDSDRKMLEFVLPLLRR